MKFFLTGTDTGIGKTLTSALLCRHWNCYYWKPIQSGLSEETDSEFVQKWIGAEKVVPEVYRLQQPLSPHLSARLDDVSIDIETILKAYKKVPDKCLIEGAGGLFVPLNENFFIIDLIQQMKLPVLLVARSSLGTINHTLLSIKALRDYKIPIAGVILSGALNPENKKAIEQYGRIPVILEIPQLIPNFQQFQPEVLWTYDRH